MLELLATAFLIGHAARAPAQDFSLIPGRGSRELESHPSGLSGKAASIAHRKAGTAGDHSKSRASSFRNLSQAMKATGRKARTAR
jgi:hypothetical protein